MTAAMLVLGAMTLGEPTPGPSPGAPSGSPATACLENDLCEFIYRQTGNDWLAQTSLYLLVKPFRILVIIVIALIVRYFANRMIKRLTGNAGEGTPGLLRPLRERMPASLQEAAGMRS